LSGSRQTAWCFQPYASEERLWLPRKAWRIMAGNLMDFAGLRSALLRREKTFLDMQ
jgi:hypothetical protein